MLLGNTLTLKSFYVANMRLHAGNNDVAKTLEDARSALQAIALKYFMCRSALMLFTLCLSLPVLDR